MYRLNTYMISCLVYISAIGVQINKKVRHRYMEKRIHVRVEHVKPSNSRNEFLARMKKNEAIKAEVKKTKGKKVNLKRSPKLPEKAAFIRTKSVTLTPSAYAGIVE